MRLCSGQLRQQRGFGESQDEDEVAATPRYLPKGLSSLGQGQAKDLPSAEVGCIRSPGRQGRLVFPRHGLLFVLHVL